MASTRSVSRYSNRSESYVYPHSAIHPLTLPNTPPFIVPTCSSPIPSLRSPSPYPLEEAEWSLRSRSCTPSLPSHLPVDPTANAPASWFHLSRTPLQLLGEGQVKGRREASWMEDEERARRDEEQQRVRDYAHRVRCRVRAEARRERAEAERRTSALPLPVQQLVYGRTCALPAGAPATRPTAAEEEKEQTSSAGPLRLDELQSSQQTPARPPTASVAPVRWNVDAAALSKAEAAAYQRRIHRLAGYRERQEALRVKAALGHQPSALQPSPPSPPQLPPPPPAPKAPRRPRSLPSVSTPVSPRSTSASASALIDLTAVWGDIERRLLRLDVAVAPLCRCSEGGGQGVGRGLIHRDGCVWTGREREYARAMLSWCEELERARGHEAMGRLREERRNGRDV